MGTGHAGQPLAPSCSPVLPLVGFTRCIGSLAVSCWQPGHKFAHDTRVHSQRGANVRKAQPLQLSVPRTGCPTLRKSVVGVKRCSLLRRSAPAAVLSKGAPDCFTIWLLFLFAPMYSDIPFSGAGGQRSERFQFSPRASLRMKTYLQKTFSPAVMLTQLQAVLSSSSFMDPSRVSVTRNRSGFSPGAGRAGQKF